jgi:hypothetical protein
MRQDESSSRRATLSASSKNPIKSCNYLIQQDFQVISAEVPDKGLKIPWCDPSGSLSPRLTGKVTRIEQHLN